MIACLLDLKERSMYDNLSMSFIKLGIYPMLIKSIFSYQVDEVDYSKTARVLELCACHQEGI